MASGKVARRTAVGDVAELLDSPEVAALIAALSPCGRGRKGFGPRALMPIIEGATRFNPRIQRHTQRFRDLYMRRVAVERAFGRLKTDFGFAPLRVRGIARVQLHADLTMLALLAQTLSRARAQAVPLAA